MHWTLGMLKLDIENCVKCTRIDIFQAIEKEQIASDQYLLLAEHGDHAIT